VGSGFTRVGIAVPKDWEHIHEMPPTEMAEAMQLVLAEYGTYTAAARQRAVDRLDVRPSLARHKQIMEMVHAQG